MKQLLALISIVLILLISVAVGQDQLVTEHYDVDEAYKVYSVLLPHEDHFNPAKNVILILEETVPEKLETDCIGEEEAAPFKDAIKDYGQANAKRWLLQRLFDTKKPYDIVGSEAIKASFTERAGWSGFYTRHPGSGGYIYFSAVGFNKDKTKAVVYSGIECGGLCARGSFHLLEKADGKWKKVDGVLCFTVS